MTKKYLAIAHYYLTCFSVLEFCSTFRRADDLCRFVRKVYIVVARNTENHCYAPPP